MTISRRLNHRRGFATGLVMIVIFIVTLIGTTLYLRVRRMSSDVAREQQDIQARFLADSALDFVTELGRRGVEAGGAIQDTPSGQIGYCLGAERADESRRRVRDGVAFGITGRYRKVVTFVMVYDGPRKLLLLRAGIRPALRPVVESVRLESLTDVSLQDLGAFPPARAEYGPFLQKSLLAATLIAN